MREKMHSIKYNFIMNFILTASNFIFPLITFPYVSRILLASGTGKVSFSTSVASYFLMIASLGIPTYGIKACAKVRDNKEELSKVTQEILLINFVATVIASFLYIICVFYVPKFNGDKTLYFIQGINIVLNMFGVNWLYQALEKYDYITYRSIFFKVISVILMFIFIKDVGDYRIYAAITVFAAVGSNLLNFIRLRKYISFRRFDNYDIKSHLKPIFILFAQSITISVYTNLDTIMLGVLKNDQEVGYYTAAVKVKGILASVVSSLGSVLMPRMSYYIKNNAKQEFYRLLSKALNIAMLMSLPLALFFIIAAKDVILTLSGSDFLPAVLTMQIITFAIIPIGLSGIIGVQVMIPLNMEKFVFWSVFVGAMSDLLLNLFLIPIYGASGAAMATTIAETVVLIVQIRLARNILCKVKNSRNIIENILLMIIPMLLLIISNHIIHCNSFLKIIVEGIVFFGFFFVELLFSKNPIVYDLVVRKRE